MDQKLTRNRPEKKIVYNCRPNFDVQSHLKKKNVTQQSLADNPIQNYQSDRNLSKLVVFDYLAGKTISQSSFCLLAILPRESPF